MAWRALHAKLADPELVMDLQAPDGSVVGLRNIKAKYASEVLGNRNVYTLCTVGECLQRRASVRLAWCRLTIPFACDRADAEGEASPLTFNTDEAHA